MVKIQRKIEFINNCCAVVDYDELEKQFCGILANLLFQKSIYLCMGTIQQFR